MGEEASVEAGQTLVLLRHAVQENDIREGKGRKGEGGEGRKEGRGRKWGEGGGKKREEGGGKRKWERKPYRREAGLEE